MGAYVGKGGRNGAGFIERAGDEVRSWFGDEEAQRRRARDERDEPRGYVEGRGRGGQWQYRDLGYREPQWTSPPQRYVGTSWTREAGYGREG